MIELYNFIRVKSIAERNNIKGYVSAARKTKQDAFFQPRAGSPEKPWSLGTARGNLTKALVSSHQHKRGWAGIGPMYSKLAYHITGLNFELIRARTVNPEQHYLNKEELCHRYATVQNPQCREIQRERYNRSASICTRHLECSADCQLLARAASHTLVWQLWFGQTQGQSWNCRPAPHGTRTWHFPFSAENPRITCCFSERLDRTPSPHVASVRAKASPCPAAQAGFHPLEGSARELPQFAFSAARLAQIRARSTQTPHKWGHTADRAAANSCPIHQGRGQEADGALKLRVARFQCEHRSEPAVDNSRVRGTWLSPHGRAESRAPLCPGQRHRLPNTPRCSLKKGFCCSTTENILHFFSAYVHLG